MKISLATILAITATALPLTSGAGLRGSDDATARGLGYGHSWGNQKPSWNNGWNNGHQPATAAPTEAPTEAPTAAPTAGGGETAEVAWAFGLEQEKVVLTSLEDEVTFVYEGGHNVFRFPDKESFENCDFTNAVGLCFQNTADCTVSASLLVANGSSGPFYFGCQLPNHCEVGSMKLEVEAVGLVDAAIDTPVAAGALVVANEVAGETAEVAWAFGLEQEKVVLTSLEDEVAFVYEGGHNVFQFPDKESFDNCNFTNAVELCSEETEDCTLDASSLVEGGSAGPFYFGCELPAHCEFGAMKVEVEVFA